MKESIYPLSYHSLQFKQRGTLHILYYPFQLQTKYLCRLLGLRLYLLLQGWPSLLP